MQVSEDLLRLGPSVIGATGGSGTRVLARIVRGAGMYIGTRFTKGEDTKALEKFGRRWINAYMDDKHRQSRFWADTYARMLKEFDEALSLHTESIEQAPRPWGWKSPPSIFLLPFLNEQFPQMKFLHVVRDGRDMAFSDNQNQLRKHGATMLEDGERDADQPIRSIALWSRSNVRAAEYGEEHMGERYRRLRFEDLCADPVREVRALFDFFPLEGNPEEVARAEVAPPDTIGRWRQQDTTIVREVCRSGEVGLTKFGYFSIE